MGTSMKAVETMIKRIVRARHGVMGPYSGNTAGKHVTSAAMRVTRVTKLTRVTRLTTQEDRTQVVLTNTQTVEIMISRIVRMGHGRMDRQSSG